MTTRVVRSKIEGHGSEKGGGAMLENSQERRRYFRLDSRIPMRYRKIEANSQEFRGSLMKNISKGGVQMTVYEFLGRNLKLALEIPLESGISPVQGSSRVAWVRKTSFSEQYDVGIEFVNLNQGDGTQIATFISSKSAE